MKFTRYAAALVGLASMAAHADELAVWTPHRNQVEWLSLGQAHGTDIYLNFSREGRIADIMVKSGVYDATHHLTQVNIIDGYFGCPDGDLPQYLSHAVSNTYDAITHNAIPNAEATLKDDSIAITAGSVLESAAKLACAPVQNAGNGK